MQMNILIFINNKTQVIFISIIVIKGLYVSIYQLLSSLKIEFSTNQITDMKPVAPTINPYFIFMYFW